MNNQIRILALFGTRVIFGAERSNMDVLAALREQGCEVLCIVRDEDWNEQIPAALAEAGLDYRKVPHIDGWMRGWRLRTLLRNPIAFSRGNWSLLRIARQFRPTHIHAFNHLHVLSFIAALSVLRVPMLYNSGDKPAQHRMIWRVLWSYVIARTRHFVAVSKFTARQLEASGVQPDGITLIYGRPPRRKLKGECPEPDARHRNIVFVGQIAEHKGVHILVEAVRNMAAAYRDLHLLVAGPISDWRGDDWARDLRSRLNEDPTLRERITFLGNIDDIPTLLRHCELLVAPSLWEEPLGLVVMEAKEASIPAIVFPRGGLPEMVDHGVDGYVCRDTTAEAIEEALRHYLDDPTRALREGKAAKASLPRFGAMSFGQQWLAAYSANAR